MTPLPVSLDRRPKWHGLPVPYVQHVEPDGTPNFAVVNAVRVYECSTERFCGLCGEGIAGPAVFLGGELSAASLAYAEPPSHPACALAALQLCPYIRGEHTQRVPEERALRSTDAMAQPGWVPTKPTSWVAVYAHHWDVELRRDPDGTIVDMLSRPVPVKVRRWTWTDGKLTEAETAVSRS